MYPKLKYHTTIPEKADRVFVTDAATSLPAGWFTPEELDWISGKFEKEETLISINRFAYQLHVARPSEKKTLAAGLEASRNLGYTLAKKLNQAKVQEVGLVCSNANSGFFMGLVEGLMLGSYQFLKYKSDADKLKNSIEKVWIEANDAVSEQEIQDLKQVVKAVGHARDLVNEPQSFLNATQFADEMKRLGKEAGFSVETLNKAKIEALKMGGLLAVNKGSVQPPTFNILEWKPENPVNEKPFVLVGKGLVYDTGGLSLKPTPGSMDSMKCDMAGGAAVVGTLYALAKNEVPVHVIGLVPSTDNRPGLDAYTPGDVITMSSGHTVEVLNTDAEGRLILGDALHYAKRYNPELVIDLATLTGAAVMAIGTNATVCMGTADETNMLNLKKAGDLVHERLAELPFWDDYADLIKSDIADMKNIGGRYAGAITAGKFLEKFTDYPWIHLDIAGPAFLESDGGYRGKGGTGVGVRLLYQFFKNIAG